jgi:hypothetical protein
MMKSAAGYARIITSIGPDFVKMRHQTTLVERAGIRNVAVKLDAA